MHKYFSISDHFLQMLVIAVRGWKVQAYRMKRIKTHISGWSMVVQSGEKDWLYLWVDGYNNSSLGEQPCGSFFAEIVF
jgi:hypothetical protein